MNRQIESVRLTPTDYTAMSFMTVGHEFDKVLDIHIGLGHVHAWIERADDIVAPKPRPVTMIIQFLPQHETGSTFISLDDYLVETHYWGKVANGPYSYFVYIGLDI